MKVETTFVGGVNPFLAGAPNNQQVTRDNNRLIADQVATALAAGGKSIAALSSSLGIRLWSIRDVMTRLGKAGAVSSYSAYCSVAGRRTGIYQLEDASKVRKSTRQKIHAHIKAHGTATINEIVAAIGVSQNAARQCTRAMELAGLLLVTEDRPGHQNCKCFSLP